MSSDVQGVSYYERATGTNSDGTPTFATDADSDSEQHVIGVLSREWGCEIAHFGKLCPVDFYVLKHGRLAAIMELKTRSHNAARFATVFLNVRKWLALTMASVALGVPAIYCVRFTNEIRWVNVLAIDARRVRMGGCMEVVKSRSDVEPVIEVGVAIMKAVKWATSSR